MYDEGASIFIHPSSVHPRISNPLEVKSVPYDIRTKMTQTYLRILFEGKNASKTVVYQRITIIDTLQDQKNIYFFTFSVISEYCNPDNLKQFASAS